MPKDPTIEEARQAIQEMLDENDELRRQHNVTSQSLLMADGRSGGLVMALKALEPKPIPAVSVITGCLLDALPPSDARIMARRIVNALADESEA